MECSSTCRTRTWRESAGTRYTTTTGPRRGFCSISEGGIIPHPTSRFAAGHLPPRGKGDLTSDVLREVARCMVISEFFFQRRLHLGARRGDVGDRAASVEAAA